jgi:hypothetical protein
MNYVICKKHFKFAKIAMRNNTTYDTGGKPITISGVSAVNPLVAYYIHGKKRGIILFIRRELTVLAFPLESTILIHYHGGSFRSSMAQRSVTSACDRGS